MKNLRLEKILADKENLERILDNLVEGIIAHDKERRILFFNRAAEKITGYKIGGISPFGAKKNLKVLLEKTIIDDSKKNSQKLIYINGGQRGTIVSISVEDLLKALNPLIFEFHK
jgi:prolyl-tRNA editing enzyme YbaK/EbsC (Cys-tRNA(Pro) deacylase)